MAGAERGADAFEVGELRGRQLSGCGCASGPARLAF